MLKEILKKLKKAGQPVTLKELSQDLGIDPEALRGMLEYLNRKGKVVFQYGDCGEPSASSCKDCRRGCTVRKTKR